MKKHILFLTGILFTAAFSTFAQLKPIVQTEKFDDTDEHLAKEAIDLRAMARFNEEHPNISDSKWHMQNKGYIVRFTSGSIKNVAFLDKKGKVTSQIRYYREQELPANVHRMVSDFIRYSGCQTIGLVQEITTGAGTAYLVTVNGATEWKVLRVAGDELNVFEEHKNG